MKPYTSPGRRGWGSILLLSLAFCGAGRAQLPTPVRNPETVRSNAPALDWSKAGRADADRLYAQVWVNTSPEYQAICRQTFNAALQQIRADALQAPRVDGVPVGARGKPLAVVADLDETILDNSGFQTQMVLADKSYSSEVWEQWVGQETGVRLTPGAGRFVAEVEKLGVTVVYLSNRSDASKQSTISTLKRLGINVSGLEDPDSRRLLLKVGRDSGKETRRRAAAEAFDILAFLGDNMGDFPEIIGSDNRRRNNRLEDYSELLGTRWFVFPNPAYGDWTNDFREIGPREYLRRDYEARDAKPAKDGAP